MIDISESVAKKTVQFPGPVLGSELIEVVRAECGEAAGRFVQSPRYDDGWLYAVGHESQFGHQNVLVTPSKTDAYIDPNKSYTSAVVVSHDLDPGSRINGSNDAGAKIDVVLEFADRLQQKVADKHEVLSLNRHLSGHAPAAGAALTAAAAEARRIGSPPRESGRPRGL